MADNTVSHTTDSRFPRTAVVLEAARVADVLRCAAAALDALASDATSYAPGTLRRRVRALRIETAHILLDIDGGAP